MSIAAPKHTHLLGATVHGLGTVTAVSQGASWPYVMVEDAAGVRHHRFLTDLESEAIMPLPVVPPYEATTERIGYGTIDEVYVRVTEFASSLPAAA